MYYLELKGSGRANARPALYDPSTGSFTATGDMLTRREWNSATLLGNGNSNQVTIGVQ